MGAHVSKQHSEQVRPRGLVGQQAIPCSHPMPSGYPYRSRTASRRLQITTVAATTYKNIARTYRLDILSCIHVID